MTPLQTSVQATLDATGRGVVAVGPVTPGTTWMIERLVTSGTSALEPQCRVYRGSIYGGQLLDTTGRGNGDVSEMETPIRLNNGETIVIEWSSGSTGSTMVMRIEGQIGDRWNP